MDAVTGVTGPSRNGCYRSVHADDDGPGHDGRVRSRLRRLLLDITPLRVSRDYRLLWTGTFISALGSQFARVGLYVQVFALTGSPAAVGLLGLSGLAGNIAGTFVGGSFIDAHDRRSGHRVDPGGHVLVAAVLVADRAGRRSPSLAVLHVANALTWMLAAINMPARQASVPRLVGDDLMPAAVALSQMQWQVTGIVGSRLRRPADRGNRARGMGLRGRPRQLRRHAVRRAGDAVPCRPSTTTPDPRWDHERWPRASATWRTIGCCSRRS